MTAINEFVEEDEARSGCDSGFSSSPFCFIQRYSLSMVCCSIDQDGFEPTLGVGSMIITIDD